MADIETNNQQNDDVDEWGISRNYNPGARKSVAQHQEQIAADGLEDYAKSLGLGIDPVLDASTDEHFLFREFWIDWYESDDAAGPSESFKVSLAEEHKGQKQFVMQQGGCYKPRLVFGINHELVSGLRAKVKFKKAMMNLGEETYTMGSFAPGKEYNWTSNQFEEVPTGMLARSAVTAHVIVFDDDNKNTGGYMKFKFGMSCGTENQHLVA